MKTYSYEIKFISGASVIVEARTIQQGIILAQGKRIQSGQDYAVVGANQLGSIDFPGTHSQR